MYILDHGRTIEMRVYPDFPVRLHSRHIHIELTYEWALVSKSSTSVTTSYSHEPLTDAIGLLVQVKYFARDSLASSPALRNMYDLALPWEVKDIPQGILLSDSGLVLKKRDYIIVLRVSQ